MHECRAACSCAEVCADLQSRVFICDAVGKLAKPRVHVHEPDCINSLKATSCLVVPMLSFYVDKRLVVKQKAAGRLVAELNELLADKEFWEPSSIPKAMARFNHLVVDIFYHDMVPDIFNAYNIRDAALAFPLSSDSDYRQVLLLGSTGGGKTTLVRQLIGSDPESERFPS